MPDMPGQVATGRDTDYSLSIEDAAQLYANAGHPRTLRSMQRYCASGHLDCLKAATALGDKYMVSPQSVARHIAQIVELKEMEARTTFRDTSRPVATQQSVPPVGDVPRQPDSAAAMSPINSPATATTDSRDTSRPHAVEPLALSRPVATDQDANQQHVERLEREADRLRDDVDFLRDQIKTKDGQIAALLERDRETNYLVRGLQHMLAPLLSSPRPERHDSATEPGFYADHPPATGV
jgi:hypothetical protein